MGGVGLCLVFCFAMQVVCFVALLEGAMGWSALFNCGISLSCSLFNANILLRKRLLIYLLYLPF